MIRDTKNRTKLEKVIPIKTPFVIQIETANICNFKCEFCMTVDNPEFDAVDKGFMEYSLFCKIIDDISEFEGKVKQMNLYRMGEPLLHPQIADMIAYAKKKQVAEKLVLFTNGSTLTPELSRKICDAGIDYIQFSIEHVNAEGYERIARIKVDYDKILANIGYLCAYKPKSCFVSAKIVDSGFTEEEKQKFYMDFKGVTDECHIETLMQVLPPDIRDTTLGHGRTTTNDGYDAIEKIVCTPSFYSMAVSWNGLVSPCPCDWKRGAIVGNASKDSMKNIWMGTKLREFWKMQLSGERKKHPMCGRCQLIFNQLDDIDEFAEEILSRFDR